MEEAVAGTNTGRSPQLKVYYAFWEQAVFRSLNKLVLNALTTFVEMLNTRSPRKVVASGGKPKPPLFKVAVQLSSPEIVVQPPLKEVTKFLAQLSRNLVRRCRLTPPSG